MPRPSRNLDRALLAAGRELLPLRGCAGLSIREVADAAGVNLGMFHYHFKTREAFLRAVLQQAYEEMFGQLTYEVGRSLAPLDHLRAMLRVLGRFLRDQRAFLTRVLADALAGDPVAVAFVRDNAPRHLGLLHGVVANMQARGELRAMPVAQALGVCAGALGAPILFGGAIADSGALGRAGSRALADALLTDAAIDERIELALAALAAPAAAARAPARARARRKS